MVDITWATSELYRKIRDWRVVEVVETLSDHLYVRMELALDDEDTNDTRRGANSSGPPPLRWRFKGRDKEMLRAAAIVSDWSWDARRTTALGNVDEEAENLRRSMSRSILASAVPSRDSV
jgi:hypothetical protein